MGGVAVIGARRDTRIRTRTSEPTFAVFEQAVDRRPTCDGCGAVATWRGEVEGVFCDLCEKCHRTGVVP